MYLAIEVQARPQIKAAIAHVMKDMTPAVQRITYEVKQDWTGEWAIFFQVLLSDEASERDNLRVVAPKVVDRIWDKIDFPNLGMFAYVSFRSQSEQAQMNDPAWA